MIVIAGLRGEDSVAELCRKEGINQNLYYRWSRDFLEAGKKRLAGDTARETTSDEVKGLRVESHQLKELLAELMMENRLLKKSVLGDGSLIREVHRRREARDHPAGRAVVVVGATHVGPTRHPTLAQDRDRYAVVDLLRTSIGWSISLISMTMWVRTSLQRKRKLQETMH
jgi:transposase-like protein